MRALRPSSVAQLRVDTGLAWENALKFLHDALRDPLRSDAFARQVDGLLELVKARGSHLFHESALVDEHTLALTNHRDRLERRTTASHGPAPHPG